MFRMLAVAGTVLAADQVTKAAARSLLVNGQSFPIIDGIFQFTLTGNTGAAFGMFSGRQPVFIAATLVAAALIVVYHIRMKESNIWLTLALGLELGGALGNLVDRIWIGNVTDFIHVTNFPVFNIADSAIVCGVILLIIVMLMDMRSYKEEKKADVSDSV